MRAREGKAINRNLDTMFKSLRKPEDDAMDTSEAAASTSRSRPTTARKIVRAKRGSDRVKKTPAPKIASPVRATRGRKRSVTPAARPLKKAKAEPEPEAKAAKENRSQAPTSQNYAFHEAETETSYSSLVALPQSESWLTHVRTRAHRASAVERQNREEVQQGDFSLGSFGLVSLEGSCCS